MIVCALDIGMDLLLVTIYVIQKCNIVTISVISIYKIDKNL